MRRLLVVVALAASQLVSSPSVASAASADGQFLKLPITLNGSYVPVVGAFDCDEGFDGPPEQQVGYEEVGVVLYAAGSGADYLWTDLASSGGGLAKTQTPLSINGSYTPVVGDFDGDDCSDILWYGPGTAPDALWWGGPSGFTAGKPIAISGVYIPVPGYHGGAAPGVFWYAPDGTEHLWLGTKNRSVPFLNVPARQVGGRSYRPVGFRNSGSGGGELLWYAPGVAADSVWSYHEATTGLVVDRITPVVLNETYVPAGCQGKVVLHAAGTPADKLFTWNNTAYVAYDLSISGSYRVAATGIATPWCTVVWHRPGAASDQIWLPRALG